ncbi:hypothetical protein CK203_018720 [Vitis vinifera]|uniref:mRNA capping enzyme C-terminal domain-containing protein n=1 Tax=Vitis vinifera TaxID=29760 RepID=A0A438JAT0_VITVI|nr:hypothetical protein CK203_018720 [Vitis vinifera]
MGSSTGEGGGFSVEGFRRARRTFPVRAQAGGGGVPAGLRAGFARVVGSLLARLFWRRIRLYGAELHVVLCILSQYLGISDGLDPTSYHGKIIECSWDFDAREWSFMRVRIDKSTPNEFGTYMKVQLIAIVFSGCFFLESFNPAGLNEVACCIVKKKGYGMIAKPTSIQMQHDVGEWRVTIARKSTESAVDTGNRTAPDVCPCFLTAQVTGCLSGIMIAGMLLVKPESNALASCPQ